MSHRRLRKNWFKLLAGLFAAGLCVWLVVMVKLTRELAEQTHCRNNLRQIGLALRNYASVHGAFPLGTLPNQRLPPEKRLSWIVGVFPYIEGNAPRVPHPDRSWDDESNRSLVQLDKETGKDYQVTSQVSPVCCCPSKGEQTDSSGNGLTEYVGVAGLGTDAPGLPPSHPRAGIFGYDRPTRDSDIKDGLSTTMAVIETASANGPWKAGGAATLRGLDPARQPYLGAGRQFGGLHRGGAQILFADGSVRFVPNAISSRVFEALSTIAGGENVGPRWAE